MLLILTGEQLGLDEDHFFDEFEVEIDDDLAEDDVIDIIQVMENDCDVSHLVDETTATRHIRTVLAVMRDNVKIEAQASARGIEI